MRVLNRFWWCKRCGIMFLHSRVSSCKKIHCSAYCRSMFNNVRYKKANPEKWRTYHRERMRLYRQGTYLNHELMEKIKIDNTLQLPEGDFGVIEGQGSLRLVSRNGNGQDHPVPRECQVSVGTEENTGSDSDGS